MNERELSSYHCRSGDGDQAYPLPCNTRCRRGHPGDGWPWCRPKQVQVSQFMTLQVHQLVQIQLLQLITLEVNDTITTSFNDTTNASVNATKRAKSFIYELIDIHKDLYKEPSFSYPFGWILHERQVTEWAFIEAVSIGNTFFKSSAIRSEIQLTKIFQKRKQDKKINFNSELLHRRVSMTVVFGTISVCFIVNILKYLFFFFWTCFFICP